MSGPARYPAKADGAKQTVDIAKLILDIESVSDVLPHVFGNQPTAVLFNRIVLHIMICTDKTGHPSKLYISVHSVLG